MQIILNIIGAVLILSFLILIHELGHYWAARKNGIKVPEFGLGFPPKLFSFKKNGTNFSVNLIPFGGYVKLHGEDSSDEKVLKDKESFASKTPWQKIEVVLAGIVMNFLVFWVCMSIALWSGVAPLVLNQDDYKEILNQGYYSVRPEVVIDETGLAEVKQGDVIVGLNGEGVLSQEEAVGLAKKDFEGIESLTIRSGNLVKEFGVNEEDLADLELYPLTMVQSFRVVNVLDSSRFNGVLLPGDLIYAVDAKPVFDLDSFLRSVYGQAKESVALSVLRDGVVQNLEIPAVDKGLYVDSVLPESKAEIGGLKRFDRIVAVDGLLVNYGDDIVKQIKDKGLETVVFTVNRAGEEMDLVLNPNEDGTVGIYLSPELKLADLGVDLVQTSDIGSLIKVKDFRVEWYKAPLVALDQGYEISKATVKGFVSTIYGIVAKFQVSEEVGGPVQVVKMSSEFVGIGGAALIQFIGLISLSLAVINLLPIPALDGGRFVFIVIEALRGKPVNPKIEAVIHSIGFMLLMGLILIITVFDIIRL